MRGHGILTFSAMFVATKTGILSQGMIFSWSLTKVCFTSESNQMISTALSQQSTENWTYRNMKLQHKCKRFNISGALTTFFLEVGLGFFRQHQLTTSIKTPNKWKDLQVGNCCSGRWVAWSSFVRLLSQFPSSLAENWHIFPQSLKTRKKRFVTSNVQSNEANSTSWRRKNMIRHQWRGPTAAPAELNDRDGNTGIFNKNCPLRLHTQSPQLESSQVQTHVAHAQNVLMSLLEKLHRLRFISWRLDPNHYLHTRNLKGALCKNCNHLDEFVAFLWQYVIGLDCDAKNETAPISLGCLHKPVDGLPKLFNAAGLWISFVKDLRSSPKDVT